MRYQYIIPSSIFILLCWLCASCSIHITPNIETEDAIQYRESAAAEIHTVFGKGGKDCSKELADRYATEGYYYFCEDFDTLLEIRTHLLSYFSYDVVEGWIESYPIKHIKGKLAFQPYESAFSDEWENALGFKHKDKAYQKIFTFTLSKEDNMMEIEIEFIVNSKYQWRINTNPIYFV